MRKAKMRIGSILLVVAMLMTLLPVGVFAYGVDSEDGSQPASAKIKVEYYNGDTVQATRYFDNEGNDDYPEASRDHFWDPITVMNDDPALGGCTKAVVTLLDDITLEDTTILIDKGHEVIINGDGHTITCTLTGTIPAGEGEAHVAGMDAISIASDNPANKLTLDNVKLVINGKQGGNATQGIYNDGTLNVENGATIAAQDLTQNGINGSGTLNATGTGTSIDIKNVDGSAIKAKEVSATSSAQIKVENAAFHGITVSEFSASDGAKVSVDQAGYMGIAASGSATMEGDTTTVSVSNSGTEGSSPAVRVTNNAFVLDGAKLTLNDNHKNAVVLNGDANASVSNNAVLTGDIETTEQKTSAVIVNGAQVTGSIVNKGTGTTAVIDSSVGAVTATNLIYSNATVGGEKQEDSDLSGAVAIDSKGQTYASLDGDGGALAKVMTSGDSITLLAADATISNSTGNTIAKGVTLIVPTGKTLTIGADGAGFLKSQGVLQVNAGGSLQLPNSDGKMETFIGTDKEARFVLTAGSISMNINPGTLTLTENSEVTVPENKVAYLILGSNKANVTVETGSKITVAGTLNLATGNVVEIASGATMTVASTGIVEVHSTAQLKGDVNVAGKVYVFEGESASTAVNSAKLNLSAGGVVYAEKNPLTADIVNAAYGILSQQEVKHSYKSVTDEIDDPATTFKHQYSVIIPDDGGSSTGTTSYGITVSTAENGTVKSSNSSAAKDATVTITVTPGEGYVLDTLTVTDKDNNTVALTKVSDTQYTFKMPASAVTVKATFKKDEGTQPAALPFNDVSESEWFYEAVKYVYDKGMMNGVSDTAFAPYSNLTRGMIAQVLYNLEGKPAVSGSAYTDVAADQWYNDAVNWAAQKGIVTGYGDGTFGPMDNITREQMAAILYRYAQYKGYDVSAKGDLTAFTDGNTVSDWAKDAMSWAVGTALFNGKGDGILDPTTTATRAEVAKILMTYCENVAK